MYCILSFAILFLAGLSHRNFIHANINHNEELSLRDFGLSSKELNEIKIVVSGILENYISPPANNLFRQKNLPVDLLLNVTLISDVISNEIGQICSRLGLIDSYSTKNKQMLLAKMDQSKNKRSRTIIDSIMNEVVSFIYKLTPIGSAVMSTLRNYHRKKKYRRQGYLLSTFALPEILTQSSPNELKIVSLVDKSQKYTEAYFDCWYNDSTLFDAPKALMNLVKYQPRTTRRIAKLRLSKSVPRHPETQNESFTVLNALTCQLLLPNYKNNVFYQCLKQLKLFDKCIEDKIEKSLKINQFEGPLIRQLSRNINNLNSSCEVARSNISLTIICPRSIGFDIYSIKQIWVAGDIFGPIFFSKSTTSANVIRKLGNVVLKSNLGRKIIQEINSLLEVYREGKIKSNELLRRSKSKPNIIDEYNKYSRQLSQYENTLTNIAMNIFNMLRKITQTIEKALVEFVSKFLKVNLSRNLRSMRCLGTIWDRVKLCLADILAKSGLTTQSRDWQPTRGAELSPMGRNNRELAENSKQPIFNLTFYFDINWLKSMQTLARTSFSRKTNTIVSLANTFLLATIFYECMVILAGAIRHIENAKDNQIQPTTTPNVMPSDDYYGPYPIDYSDVPTLFDNEEQQRYQSQGYPKFRAGS